MNTQKVALVTGAGSGIGRAVALALAKDGYEVVLVGRREDALKATVVMGESTRLHAMVADVTDHHAVQALFDQVESQFGAWMCCLTTQVVVRQRCPLKSCPSKPGSML